MSLTIVFAAVLSSVVLCKMSQCGQEVAGDHENFCPNHLCATEGCHKPVKVGGMPGWMQKKQAKNQFVAPGQKPEKYVPPRLVWAHCQEHACARTCPRGDNVSGAFEGLEEDSLIERAACKDERLYKGKYCAKHTCAVKGCLKPVLEKWKKVDKPKDKNAIQPARSYDELESEEYCMAHIKMKGTEHAKHTPAESETVTARNKRIAEEKAAKAAPKPEQGNAGTGTSVPESEQGNARDADTPVREENDASN